MQTEKISKIVASTLVYLDNAVTPEAKMSEKEVIQLTWKAASNLEYCLFLFSLAHPEEINSSWELPKIKQPYLTSLLASTRSLLKEAADSLEADHLKEAHKKTWLARGQLHRIHDFFWKKRASTLGNS